MKTEIEKLPLRLEGGKERDTTIVHVELYSREKLD